MAETVKKNTQTKEVNKTTVKKSATKTELEDKGFETREKKVPMVAKDIDPHTIVTVKNGFQGKLIYKSAKTGEKFVWSEFGAEQEMELAELRNARNASKKFFINNWFMFDEPWVVDYLAMGQYYKNALKLDEFDELFTKTPEEIKKQVSLLSKGQKQSVSYRARQLVAEEKIDSIKAISALEESLGVELIVR